MQLHRIPITACSSEHLMGGSVANIVALGHNEALGGPANGQSRDDYGPRPIECNPVGVVQQMTIEISTEILGHLRAAKATAQTHAEVRDIIAAKEAVLARYSPNFQPGEIASISEETLRSFLYFENNRHWTGLNRQVNRICVDMESTRTALIALVDSTRPLSERMEAATSIRGMGKGIITAILHVAYPDDFGVWYNTADPAPYLPSFIS